VVKAAEEIQDLVTSEVGSLLMIAGQKNDVVGSKAVIPEASRGNPDSPHTANIINIESSSTSVSLSDTFSSSSTSSDYDDVPLGKIYTTIHKSLPPSTKLHKKPVDNTPYEPMNPSVDDRIYDMAQMRFKVCERLPPNHPFQPPMIEPLSFVPADADVIGEHVGSESSNPNESSSSHPTTTTQTS
jgi:hypothetical protein